MWQALAYYAMLGIESVAGAVGIRLYEEPSYVVQERVGEAIEIRRYASRLAAEAVVGTPGEAGRNEAFMLLFDYIAGANRAAPSAKRIAMTTPVDVREAQRLAMSTPVDVRDEGGVRIRFFLPAALGDDGAPEPMDERVRIVSLPEETIATLRFSGTGRDLRARQAALLAALDGSPWQPAGEPYALFYDAPFTLPFVRRNEAAVRVAPRTPPSPPLGGC
jgi:hypothetical protein